jgi:hypothetical protein
VQSNCLISIKKTRTCSDQVRDLVCFGTQSNPKSTITPGSMILIIYKAFIFLEFNFLQSTQFSEINHISLPKPPPQPSQPQSNMGSEELFIRSYSKEFWGQNPETLSQEEMDVMRNRYTSHWNSLVCRRTGLRQLEN